MDRRQRIILASVITVLVVGVSVVVVFQVFPPTDSERFSS